jgi:hypothetical protein
MNLHRIKHEVAEAAWSFDVWYDFAMDRQNPKSERLVAAYHAMIDAATIAAMVDVVGEEAGSVNSVRHRFARIWSLIHDEFKLPDVPLPWESE